MEFLFFNCANNETFCNKRGVMWEGEVFCRSIQIGIFLFYFIEPVGSSVPKYPYVMKAQGVEVNINQNYALLCPVQGFPVPVFRWVKIKI